MADVADQAQDVNELHQELSLSRQRAKVLPELHPDFDGEHCVDCETPIPAKRLEWGRVRCVDCQEDVEHTAALYRHNRPVDLGSPLQGFYLYAPGQRDAEVVPDDPVESFVSGGICFRENSTPEA